MERTLIERFLGIFTKTPAKRSTVEVARILEKYYENEDILTAALLRKHEWYSIPKDKANFFELYADDRVIHYLEFLNDENQVRGQTWLEKNNQHLDKIWKETTPWQAVALSIAYAIDEIEIIRGRGRNQERPTLGEALGYYKRYYSIVKGWKEVDNRLLSQLKTSIQELHYLL